jgi:hypothetical protein
VLTGERDVSDDGDISRLALFGSCGTVAAVDVEWDVADDA